VTVRGWGVTFIAAALAAVFPGRAQTSLPRPEFEVASIKQNKDGGPRVFVGEKSPGTFSGENATLQQLIQRAYGGIFGQRTWLPFETAAQAGLPILGGPSWLGSERFDVIAKWKAEPTVQPRPIESTLKAQAQMGLMLQTLLEQRFQLMIHRETKEIPVYELTIAKNPSKLRPSSCTPYDPVHPIPTPASDQPSINYCGSSRIRRKGLDWTFDGTAITVADLAGTLSWLVDQHRPVVDKTGFSGKFDVHLQWTPGLGELGEHDLPAPPEASGPSIFSVLEEQLGLKLKTGRAPVEVLVVDHAEMPSAN
jgi:uncharacterized protein (TIGR03435 family)